MVKKTTAKAKAKTANKSVKETKPKKTVSAKKAKTTQAAKDTAAASTKKTGAKAKKTALTAREQVIHSIKQDLLSQRSALLREAEETLSTLPTDLNFPDMGDQATAETDRNFILRLRDRERMLLKKIEETIERIDSSDYGMCEECGNEIGMKRLEARPVTTCCIECKTRQEEEERIAGGG